MATVRERPEVADCTGGDADHAGDAGEPSRQKKRRRGRSTGDPGDGDN